MRICDYADYSCNCKGYQSRPSGGGGSSICICGHPSHQHHSRKVDPVYPRGDISPAANLQRSVFAALENSIDNGYDPEAMPLPALVADLRRFDADLETFQPEAIQPDVVIWIGIQRRRRREKPRE